MNSTTIYKIIFLLLLIAAAILWWLMGSVQRFEIQNAQPAAATPHYQLRFGHNLSTNSALHLAAQKFADTLKQASDGQLTVAIFPDQQLGTDQQMLAMARQGTLDIVLTPTAKLSTLVPAMQYVDLPFFFPDRQTLYQMLDGEPGQILLDKLKAIGLVGVAFWETGFKQFTANRPIRQPADLRNLKVRIMKSRLLQTQFTELGAQPLFTDFNQIHQALQDGVADAQENPLTSIVEKKLYEVQSHLTLSNHAYLGSVLSFSEKTLVNLPLKWQSLLINTAKELTAFQRQAAHSREDGYLQTLRTAGMQIQELSPDERQAFAQAMQYLPAWFELEIGADILSKTEEMQWQNQLNEHPESVAETLIVGLDADLSSGSAQSGVAIKRGILMAMAEINAAGGVLGKKLHLLARDHKALPSIGVSNIHYFNSHPNLTAVISGIHSPVALAELDVLHSEKIPLLVSWAAAAGVTENNYDPNYVFRVSINDRYVAPFMIDYALGLTQQNTQYVNIALWLENSAWGRGNAESMRAELANNNAVPVAIEWLNRGQDANEYQAQLSRIEQASADVIIMVANPIEGIEVVNLLATRNIHLPLISHWGITSGRFWEATRDSLKKVHLVFPQTTSFVQPKSDRQRRFVQHYLQRYGGKTAGDIVSPVGTAHAYELVHLLALAIQQAGTLDREVIRDALEEIQLYSGLIKTYAPPFTPQNHDALSAKDYHMAHYNDNGWIEPADTAHTPTGDHRP